MAEVLSQSEIDALLSGINSGEIDAKKVRANERESKVRSYDFRRAMRFSKDHLRVIRRIHEQFSRLLSSRLSAQLRTVIQIQVESVDQVPYEEFIRSIPVLTVLNLMEMSPLEGRIVFEMNPQIVFAMLDRFMGGDSLIPYRERQLTDIEMTLLRRLVMPTVDALSESWRGIVSVEPELISIDSNPQFLQLATPNETVLVVAMSVRIGETSGLVSLCIPHQTVEPIMPLLNNHYIVNGGRKRESRDEQKRSDVQSHMMGVPVDVEVRLGSAELSVRELLNLEIDDTLILRQTIRDPALVYVDGTPAFWASVGKKNHAYAVRILREWEEENDRE